MAQREGSNEPPVLDFERPVVELEKKIDELRHFAQSSTELQREHGGMMQRVTLRSGSVEIQPVPHLPPINCLR